MTHRANRNYIITRLKGISFVVVVMERRVAAMKAIKGRCARHSAESHTLVYKRPRLNFLRRCRNFFSVAPHCNFTPRLRVFLGPFDRVVGSLTLPFRVNITAPFIPPVELGVYAQAARCASPVKPPFHNSKIIKRLLNEASSAFLCFHIPNYNRNAYECKHFQAIAL